MRVSVVDLTGQLVYYPDMASIVGKKRGNQTYYYLVESARVNGKPRIVSQEYLGSTQEVMDRLSGAAPGRPERTQHKAFGGLAAVWGILDRLGVVDAIDEVCGSRRSDAGASVGTYLALAPANRPDVTQFGAVLDELTSRYAALLDTHGDADTADSAPSGPTVVFDAGQNSAANFAHLTGAGLHYVGSLPPSSFPDLLAVPARRRHPVDPDTYPGLSAYDTRAMVFGVDRRVVLTHSANLHAKQAAGFDQTLAKTTRELGELAATLARGKTRREPDAVQAEVTRITHPRWVARVLTTQLTGTTAATMRLTWQIDDAARKALESEIFGKRLLVTDHDDWAVPEVVAGYRCQNDVESGFRQLKDPHVVGFSPMFHWTESKIRVHVFYCVLALAVAHLMRRQALHGGLDLSTRELLANLAGIQETVLLYPTGNKGRPRAQRILTDTDPTQKRLHDIFGLDAYAPKR